MVLVHTRQADDTTLEVIQWLQSKNKQVFRINRIDDIENADELIEKGLIKSIYFNGAGTVFDRIPIEDNILKTHVISYLEEDISAIWVNLYSKKAPNIKVFGQLPYPRNVLNKVTVLEIAKSLGFEIPNYKIIYKKGKLIEFKTANGRIICKSLVDGINIHTNDLMITGQRTEEITSKDIENFGETFFPTFVQQLIDKIFEVRVFCFNGNLYSIATFSQLSDSSKIDGRTIDIERPQRRIPFHLPKELADKIRNLLTKLTLNYGSLDFIVTADHQFYFLEVNPYGQYGFVSKAGNFYLEKEIANYL